MLQQMVVITNSSGYSLTAEVCTMLEKQLNDFYMLGKIIHLNIFR